MIYFKYLRGILVSSSCSFCLIPGKYRLCTDWAHTETRSSQTATSCKIATMQMICMFHFKQPIVCKCSSSRNPLCQAIKCPYFINRDIWLHNQPFKSNSKCFGVKFSCKLKGLLKQNLFQTFLLSCHVLFFHLPLEKRKKNVHGSIWIVFMGWPPSTQYIELMFSAVCSADTVALLTSRSRIITESLIFRMHLKTRCLQ